MLQNCGNSTGTGTEYGPWIWCGWNITLMFSVNSGFYITTICKMSRSSASITFSRWIPTFLSCSRRLVLNCGWCHSLHSAPFDVVALAITVAVTFANIFSVDGVFCITWFHWMTCSSAPQIPISRILMFLSWSSRKVEEAIHFVPRHSMSHRRRCCRVILH